ncbi:MAG TPA: winged helix-turn-helix domain-containing protein, partial [Dokdonella sp.]
MVLRSYRFGRFRLDPATRELWNGGERVALAPKSFDCLSYLIEQRSRAVGRDELISAVWGRVDVSDALLGQTLARARRAIGDTGGEQSSIRTVPRFGYRWVAATEVAERDDASIDAVEADARAAQEPRAPARAEATPAPAPAGDAAPLGANAAPRAPRPRRRRRALVAALVLAAAAGCAALLVAARHEPARPRPVPPP